MWDLRSTKVALGKVFPEHFGLLLTITGVPGGTTSRKVRVRFPIILWEFLIDIRVPATLWSRGRLSLLTETNPRNISWGR